MSSLSNLPYGHVLDYWYEKLKYHKCRNKFLVTKFFEIFSFRSKKRGGDLSTYIKFPQSVQHTLPDTPKVAIVIPVFAQCSKDISDLANLFTSIQKQNIQAVSVIIVDDASLCSYSVPKEFNTIKLGENSGPAKARNIGKSIALKEGADIIAFTDADCILKMNWIESIINFFSVDNNASILSGNTISYDKQWLGVYHNLNGTLNGRKFNNLDKLLYGTTANLAITSEVAKNIDFNTSFPKAAGEDIEFCFRANMSGFSIKYNKDMEVYHNYGYSKSLFSNLKKFKKQFSKYGEGESILLREIPNYYAYFDKTEEISTYY